MKQLLNKIGIKGSLQKNFGAIVILAFTGFLRYLGFHFSGSKHRLMPDRSTYHLTNTQYGEVFWNNHWIVWNCLRYSFGGVVADGMSVKRNYCIITNRERESEDFFICFLLDLEDFLEFMRCGVYLQHLHSGRRV